MGAHGKIHSPALSGEPAEPAGGAKEGADVEMGCEGATGKASAPSRSIVGGIWMGGGRPNRSEGGSALAEDWKWSPPLPAGSKASEKGCKAECAGDC